MVAPALIENSYVDHDLSANLDSTFAFEGPEKLLEVWFWDSPDNIPAHVISEGLKAIPLAKWKSILDLVSCKILSMKSSPAVDAYLLSELSLFVFPHKLILKTCGTTTTLAALAQLFEIVREFCGADGRPIELNSMDTSKVFYSRRSFMFPEKQKHVHTDWKCEVELLNQHFAHGKLYVVGDFTSDDHWYLYTGGSGSNCSTFCAEHDQTFEILMTQLDPVKAKQFSLNRVPGAESEVDSDHDLGHEFGDQTMGDTSLKDIFTPRATRKSSGYPSMPSPEMSDDMKFDEEEPEAKSPIGFIHDSFAFTPCGFSSNSISTGKGGYYYTLHITPESGWSYASFETNYPFSANSSVSVTDVLLRVLAIFSPGRFSLTMISDIGAQCLSQAGIAHHESLLELTNCDNALAKLGYQKHEKVVYDLKGQHNLLYLHFEKE